MRAEASEGERRCGVPASGTTLAEAVEMPGQAEHHVAAELMDTAVGDVVGGHRGAESGRRVEEVVDGNGEFDVVFRAEASSRPGVEDVVIDPVVGE